MTTTPAPTTGSPPTLDPAAIVETLRGAPVVPIPWGPGAYGVALVVGSDYPSWEAAAADAAVLAGTLADLAGEEPVPSTGPQVLDLTDRAAIREASTLIINRSAVPPPQASGTGTRTRHRTRHDAATVPPGWYVDYFGTAWAPAGSPGYVPDDMRADFAAAVPDYATRRTLEERCARAEIHAYDEDAHRVTVTKDDPGRYLFDHSIRHAEREAARRRAEADAEAAWLTCPGCGLRSGTVARVAIPGDPGAGWVPACRAHEPVARHILAEHAEQVRQAEAEARAAEPTPDGGTVGDAFRRMLAQPGTTDGG